MASPVPCWDGQAVFGDPSQFTAAVFTGSAAQADAFLGNAPGTTVYPPCRAPGGAIAIFGVLVGASSGDVEAAQAVLVGLAAVGGVTGTARLIVKTGFSGPPVRGWDAWDGCWFVPADLVFDAGGIQPGPWPGFRLAYRLIVRCGGLIQAGSMQAPFPQPFYPVPWGGHTPSNPYVP